MRVLILAIFALSLVETTAAEEPACHDVDVEEASLLQSRHRVGQLPSSTVDPGGSIDDEFGQAIGALGDLKGVPSSTISQVGESLKQAMNDWQNAQVEQKKWNEANDKLKKIEESVEDTATPEGASLVKSRQRVGQLPSSTVDPGDSIGDEFGQAMGALGDLKGVPSSTISKVGESLKQAMNDWQNAQVEQKKWNEANDKLKKIEESVEDTPTPEGASLVKSRQ